MRRNKSKEEFCLHRKSLGRHVNYREEGLLWQPSTKQEAKYLRCHHRRKNYKENSDTLKYSLAFTAQKSRKDKIQINGSLGTERDVNLMAVYSFWFVQIDSILAYNTGVMNTAILQLTAMLPERHHISWCTSFHVTHWLNSLRNDHHQEEETRASAEVTLNYTTAAQKSLKREEGEGHKLMQRWARTGDIRLQVCWCHFFGVSALEKKK